MYAEGKPSVRSVAAISLVLATSVLLTSVGVAQQQPQRVPGTLTEGVTAVLVDVVVRDRRGQPVRDLTAADFEVLEDGVPQKLGSFTPMFDRGGVVPLVATPTAPTTTESGGGPRSDEPLVTALVFDQLSLQGRQLAIKAAESYLGTKEQTSSYFGVFVVDLSLVQVAPFTRNAAVLRAALTRAGSKEPASLGTDPQQRANAENRAAAAAQTAESAIAAGGQGTNAAVGGAPGEALLAEMQAEMIRGFDAMANDQQGYAATNALFSIVASLRRLPGRKSLVLFSEGIAVPDAVQRLYTGVIDAANRANVAIYTVDAAGLRAESEQGKIRNQVNAAGGGGGGILGGTGGDPSGRALTKALENNEFVLRQDPRTNLGELARSTGGLMFEGTNNLRPAFDRIEEDLHNYYLLGYTPANEKYDGKFRTIQVKVNRPGVTIAARKGYFAVRNSGATSFSATDAAALAALEQKPVPNAFPVRAGALLFPERGRPGLIPTVVEFRTAPIAFQPAADGKTYTSDFTVLVRFLDARNQVVRTISQHYEINGPIDQLERAKAGDVIFYREPELPPGVYSMESIVHDALGNKASVRFSTVEIPKAADGALRMSSLMLVKRTEKADEKARRIDNPLIVKDTILYPNLGDPVSKASKEVAFYYAVYPGAGQTPESWIELMKNGQLVARLPIPSAAADAAGRMQQFGRIPLDQLEPGTYDLRAVVKQGSEQIMRSTILRIVE